MNRVIIEVSGGVAEIIASTARIEVHLFDWDNIREGDKHWDRPVILARSAEKQFEKHLKNLRKQAKECRKEG